MSGPLRFDGYHESMLSESCLDESGRWVNREQQEAEHECSLVLREERLRREHQASHLLLVAVALMAVIIFILSTR